MCPRAPRRDNYRVVAEQLGSAYGEPTDAARETQILLARHKGIVLDMTYTAKAMAGLIAGVRDGRYRHGEALVFMHTGGLAGFFR